MAAPPPPEYVEFTLRRAFHQELGLDMDEMEEWKVQLYSEYMRLERKYQNKENPQ